MGTQYVGNLLIQIERWRWRHRGGKVMRAQKDSEGRRLITGCAHKGSLVILLDKDHTSGAAREVFAVLRIYFFTLHGDVCQFHLTFLYDAPLYFYQTDSDEMTVYPCRSLTHPTHWLVVTKSPFFRLFRRRPGFDKGLEPFSKSIELQHDKGDYFEIRHRRK